MLRSYGIFYGYLEPFCNFVHYVFFIIVFRGVRLILSVRSSISIFLFCFTDSYV